MEGVVARSKKEWSVGVDVSAKQLHVAIEGVDEVLVFNNDAAGFKALVGKLTKGGRCARVVLEATGTYHLDLALVLHRHKRCRVSVVNPRSTKNFHDALNVRAKTDKVDARILLIYAERMAFAEWEAPDGPTLEYRALARYYDQLVREQTRVKNHLHAALVTGTTPEWIVEQHRQRLADISTMMNMAQSKLDEFAAEHDDIGQQVRLLMTVPGIGKVTAHALVALYRLLDPDMTSSEITAWAGLDPRPKESGSSVRGRRGISKRGSARARRALYMPAVTVLRGNSPMRHHYDRVVARAGKNMIGIVAIMRKLLIISWAIHRTKVPWNADKARPRAERLAA